ncbi:MAG: glycerophosphodiester phosphodiesterase family protein [bacterium]
MRKALLIIISALVFQFSVISASENTVKIIAHRGVKKFAPENTLPAIQKAIGMGIDYVEIDIRETRDGEIVLMHNSTVDATTNGGGAVSEMTLEDIKKLDAGVKFSEKFKGTQVPTMREAFAIMQGKIGGYIDFKAGSPEKVVRIVEEFKMEDDVVVYGGIDRLLEVQKHNKRIKVMPGIDNINQLKLLMKSMDLKVVETSIDIVTKEYMAFANESGIMVFMDILGLSDNRTGMKRALKLKPYAIQTDHPDILLKVLQGK